MQTYSNLPPAPRRHRKLMYQLPTFFWCGVNLQHSAHICWPPSGQTLCWSTAITNPTTSTHPAMQEINVLKMFGQHHQPTMCCHGDTASLASMLLCRLIPQLCLSRSMPNHNLKMLKNCRKLTILAFIVVFTGISSQFLYQSSTLALIIYRCWLQCSTDMLISDDIYISDALMVIITLLCIAEFSWEIVMLLIKLVKLWCARQRVIVVAGPL